MSTAASARVEITGILVSTAAPARCRSAPWGISRFNGFSLAWTNGLKQFPGFRQVENDSCAAQREAPGMRSACHGLPPLFGDHVLRPKSGSELRPAALHTHSDLTIQGLGECLFGKSY